MVTLIGPKSRIALGESSDGLDAQCWPERDEVLQHRPLLELQAIARRTKG
jgi:hypothetical protein